MDWIQLAPINSNDKALVNMVMVPDILYEAGNFLTSSMTLFFSRLCFSKVGTFLNLFMVYLTTLSETEAIKHWLDS